MQPCNHAALIASLHRRRQNTFLMLAPGIRSALRSISVTTECTLPSISTVAWAKVPPIPKEFEICTGDRLLCGLGCLLVVTSALKYTCLLYTSPSPRDRG
eukprot:2838654-Amphidinium_carterae.1